MWFTMPTVLREKGFHVQINTRDHWPPHVHVYKAGCEARFALQGNTVTLLRNAGFRAPELAEAADIIEENYATIDAELRKMSWVKLR
jgi:hypothetical protein